MGVKLQGPPLPRFSPLASAESPGAENWQLAAKRLGQTNPVSWYHRRRTGTCVLPEPPREPLLVASPLSPIASVTVKSKDSGGTCGLFPTILTWFV